MTTLPFCRLQKAADQLGCSTGDLTDRARTGLLRLSLVAEDLEYSGLLVWVDHPDGRTERLLLPPPMVPEGESACVPAGLYPLPPGVAHRAVSRGRAYVTELATSKREEVYVLARRLDVGPLDIVIEAAEWSRFDAPLRAVSSRPADGAPSGSEGGCPASARGPAGSLTKQDLRADETPAERWVSTRVAARILRTRNERLYSLAEDGLRAGVARPAGSGTTRRHTRWREDLLAEWWATVRSTP
jgi:hypothetical protein